MWQVWQEFVLKIGPSPSLAAVVAGAVTQAPRKKESPMKKLSLRERERFGAGREKTPRESAWNFEITMEVPPPENGGFARLTEVPARKSETMSNPV